MGVRLEILVLASVQPFRNLYQSVQPLNINFFKTQIQEKSYIRNMHVDFKQAIDGLNRKEMLNDLISIFWIHDQRT